MKNINRIICTGTVLLFSLLLTGCNDTPQAPDADTTEFSEQISEPIAEQLVGNYKTYSEENGETVMQIYLIKDRLVAEVEEEYAAYYAMEWFPMDSDVTDSDTSSEKYTVYSFSGFSNFGEYWDTVQHITVALTDTGCEITDEKGETTRYTRDHNSTPIHNPEIYSDFSQDTADDALVGEWTAVTVDGYSILFQLDKFGNVTWCSKKEGEPIEYYIGLAITDSQTGTIQTISERVGWSQMPWQYSFEYAFDTDGKLILKNTEPDGLLPTNYSVEFIKDNNT